MRRRVTSWILIFLAGAVSAPGCVRSQLRRETPLISDDEAAIRKIIANGADAYNRHDPKALAADLAEDADHIGGSGIWGSGKNDIETKFAEHHAPNEPKYQTVVRVAKIRFLTPDVAIAIVPREYRKDEEVRKAVSTMVFQKVGGRWWIAAFQNTFIGARAPNARRPAGNADTTPGNDRIR